jgi:hypothetical protein
MRMWVLNALVPPSWEDLEVRRVVYRALGE